MLSRHHATQGGRASSLNVTCEPSNAHEGAVSAIWGDDDGLEWVTGGVDGKVKVWKLHPATKDRSGKRAPSVIGLENGYLECLFTSDIVTGPFANRSDAVKRRQNGYPDSVIAVRYGVCGVACGVTADGDLRVWFGVGGTTEVVEVRVDVGSEEESGPVVKLELHVEMTGWTCGFDIDITRFKCPLHQIRYRPNTRRTGSPHHNIFSTDNGTDLHPSGVPQTCNACRHASNRCNGVSGEYN
jgi:hypothetical protein